MKTTGLISELNQDRFWLILIHLLLMVCLIVPNIVTAEELPPAIVTEQNLRDAILEHRQFSPEQLQQMDLNGDGQVDVADLVMLLDKLSPGAPVANFDLISSEVREGEGTASVRINFSTHFSGTLYYSLSGTATAGSDFDALSGSIPVDGVFVDLPISIVDDDELEENAETLTLAVYYETGAGLGYLPGALTEHTLNIVDNDAYWNGIIENSNIDLHFKMKIIRVGSTTTGALIADGFGIIPLIGASTEWQAVSMSLGATWFNADIPEMAISAIETLAGTDLKRRFVFTANQGTSFHIVNPNSEIKGTVREYINFSGQPQFNREIVGSFTLVRQVSMVEPQEVPLTDAE